MSHHGEMEVVPQKYPEHEKLRAAKKTDDATHLVGEFVDWLHQEKHIVFHVRGQVWRYCVGPLHDETLEGVGPESGLTCSMCEGTGEVLREGWTVAPPLMRLLYEFFDIDHDTLEEEKLGMLEEIRAGIPKAPIMENVTSTLPPSSDTV